MRVLLVSHGAGPYGAERILLAAAEGLARRGHQVVLSFPHHGPAADAAGRLAGVEVRLDGRRRLPRSRGELPMFLLAAPAAVAAVRRLVRDVRPQVVWISSMYNPWAAAGARLAGRPVIWHLHERVPPGPFGLPLAALIGLVAARTVAVSDFVAGGFGRYPWLRGRTGVIHNPLLDAPAHPRAEPSGPFTVGCVGQLEPHKRATDVVKAVARLPDVRAVLVGDGKGRAEVEAAVRAHGVQDRVELLGYRPDVAAAAARFHCIAIPSAVEGFGLVALEAMALGVPVVAARSGALPEVLGDCALYSDPGDAADLARQIDRLRADPALRAVLRDRGIRRAAKFGREQWLDRIEAMLNEVVPDGGSE